MLRLLEVAYIGLFLLLVFASMRDDLLTGAPRWKLVLSTIGDALGVSGMVMYVRGTTSPEIASVWRYVFALLIVQLAVEARFEFGSGLRRMVPESELEEPQTKSLIKTALGMLFVFALPYLWMNAALAFGQPS